MDIIITPVQKLRSCVSEPERRRQWHPTPVLCLENPMNGGAWWAAVHGVTKSWTRLSNFTFTFHFHALEKEMATHSCSCLENPRDGGAWWLPSMGSHRVGHKWSNLAAAAAYLKNLFEDLIIYHFFFYQMEILSIDLSPMDRTVNNSDMVSIMCLLWGEHWAWIIICRNLRTSRFQQGLKLA